METVRATKWPTKANTEFPKLTEMSGNLGRLQARGAKSNKERKRHERFDSHSFRRSDGRSGGIF